MQNDAKPRRAFGTALILWLVGYVLVIALAVALAINSEDTEAPDNPGMTSGPEAPQPAETASWEIQADKKAEVPAAPAEEQKTVETVPATAQWEIRAEIAPEADTPAEPETLEYAVYDDIPLDGKLQLVMQEACEKYGVPFELALAVAEAESTFDPEADNGLCLGLMQINRVNFDWLRGLGIDPETPEGNIEAGVYILSGHLKDYEDWNLALMAYNCGAASARRQWSDGYTSSRYSRSVVAHAQSWSAVIRNTKSS